MRFTYGEVFAVMALFWGALLLIFGLEVWLKFVVLAFAFGVALGVAALIYCAIAELINGLRHV